ncbi:hypothetical protein PAXINDRAFT_39023, partial [Paxillus involutus ATCC 200175]
EEHASKMVMTSETHLLGDHSILGTSLNNVPGAVCEVKARLVWVQVLSENGVHLELIPRFQVEMEHNWYETTVTALLPHRIVSVVDWTSDSPMPLPVATEEGKYPIPKLPKLSKATYEVFPWGVDDPHSLSYGCKTVKELGDTLASPASWHTLPVSWDLSVGESDRAAMGDSFWRTTNTTWGNNVFAHESWHGRNVWMYNRRSEGSTSPSPLGENFLPLRPNPAQDSMVEAQSHIDATVTQLFYTSNMAHDLFYRYGFTEATGNFQQYNFRRGSAEGDAVIANAQDGSGFNNTNFMTPPDGQNGRCRMYLWNTASPYPNGDMEAGIVIHELAHGLSTRLTGRPKNSGCLGWGESSGMGLG